MIYGKLPVVFLSVLESERPDSTNRVIASYILDHLDEVKDIGIQEFASDCNVSISSISRFCRQIGLENFAELKMMLQEALLQRSPEPIGGSFADRKRVYREKTKDAIEEVTASLSEKDVQDLVDDLVYFRRWPRLV